MISFIFLISASGLFDFDYTLPAEALLFLVLAGVITSVFLLPISAQLDLRQELIDFKLKKSLLILRLAREKVGNTTTLLSEEVFELNRQLTFLSLYANAKLEDGISMIKDENAQILSNFQSILIIRSAYIFSKLAIELDNLVSKFFINKLNF